MKSQSAMEYLMTYGWAILIIAVVLGALFQLGVFNATNFAPRVPAGACQVERLATQIALAGECQGGLPQYVAEFGAAPSYVLVSGDSHLPTAPSASRSITMWIDPTTIPHGLSPDTWGGTVFTQPLNGYPNMNVCGGFNLLISNWNNPFLHKCINDVGWSIAMQENTWEFIAVVYSNASDTITFYLDGQSSTVTNNGMFTESQNLTIGGWDDYAPTMTGYAANFQVYNASLSSSEVNALYMEGIGGAPIDVQNIVGWWPLNGNANDYSGEGAGGQATNMMYTGSYLSEYTPP